MNTSEWMIVPREPTREMEAEIRGAIDPSPVTSAGLRESIRDAIAAAPPFPWPTPEEAVAILNERRHGDADCWEALGHDAIIAEEAGRFNFLDGFEARAIALAYLLGMPGEGGGT